MVYTIFMWMVIAGATIFFGGAVILLSALDRHGCIYNALVDAWARTIVRLSGCGLSIDGLGRLDPGKPYVFMVNHQSYFDVICLSRAVPGKVRFVAKRELIFVPVLGLAMWASGHIFIDRGKKGRAMESMRRAAQKIRAGTSILVFPEGTRSHDHKVGGFKKGGFLLAVEAQVPVVPVALSGTSPMMPKGSFSFRRTDATVVIGEPIPTAGLDPDAIPELMETTRRAVISLFPEGCPEAVANRPERDREKK